jgi:hypothetical protein
MLVNLAGRPVERDETPELTAKKRDTPDREAQRQTCR